MSDPNLHDTSFTLRREGTTLHFRTVFTPEACQGFLTLSHGADSVSQSLTAAELDMLRETLHNPWGKR